jgi:DME family drug/metabolite transporter
VRQRDFLLIVSAAVLWGGGGVVGRLLGDHTGIHPLSVALWRMVLGGAALLLFLAVTGRFRPRSMTAEMWRRAAITGALTATFEAAFFSALQFTSVGVTTLIGIGSTPVFVALWDWLRSRELPAGRTLLAFALAVTGLGALMAGSLNLGQNGLLGSLLALATGVSFAAIAVVNRVPVEDFEPVVLTAWVFATGAVFSALIALPAGIGAPSDAKGWLLAALLGIVITAVAYVAFLTGLATVPPFVATILTLLEPMVATLLGVLILHERLGALGIAGAVLLGTAVVLLRPERDEPETIH